MDSEIVELIKNYLREGYSENQIKEALQKKGMDEKSINKIIKSSKPQQEDKKINKTTFLIVGVILLILVSTVYVFYINKPRTSQDYIQKGASYFNERDHDKALENFNKAKELDPDNYLIYVWLSSISFEKDDYNGALQLLDKASELNPNNSVIHQSRGWTYLRLEYYDKALEEFKRALELNPNHETRQSIYFGAGEIYLEYLYDQS